MSDDRVPSEDVVMGQDDPVRTARTLLCNRCHMMIFGDNTLAPMACCTDMFCNHCWTAILRDGERCTAVACQNALLKRRQIYLTEDDDDILSRERSIDRQLQLESDASYQRVQAEIGTLNVRIERQKQQLQGYTQMNGVLDDQIRQAANRLDAVQNETNQLKEMFDDVERKTHDMRASNRELEEQIQIVRKRIQVLERLAARRGQSAQSSSAPL